MLGETHELISDFPEHRDRIEQLRIADVHFARLCGAYDDVNREVLRIEQGIETPSDAYTEELKKRRVLLKDQVYTLLIQS